jgi:hypothetical protein
MKRDLTRLPAMTPESLRTAVRFSLHDAPKRGQLAQGRTRCPT